MEPKKKIPENNSITTDSSIFTGFLIKLLIF